MVFAGAERMGGSDGSGVRSGWMVSEGRIDRWRRWVRLGWMVAVGGMERDMVRVDRFDCLSKDVFVVGVRHS